MSDNLPGIGPSKRLGNQKPDEGEAMKFTHALPSVLLAIATCAFAQQSLTGRYEGFVSSVNMNKGKVTPVPMSVEIKQAENGSLSGTITSGSRGCGGTFPVTGTYKDNAVTITQTEASTNAGCGKTRMELTMEGNKLVGKMSWDGGMRDVSMSK
jgi:hypothetical protein